VLSDRNAMTQPAAPQSVLVVEDDLDLRLIIVESLEASGFAVAQATEAADAIDRLQGFAYDGLVVDLKLPDGDGRRVLEEALTRYPQMRAVVMTGFGGVDDAVSAIKRGAVDFLIKPFQLSQLSRVLRTSLEQLRLKEENAELKAQLHDRFRFDSVVGQHPSVQRLFATLELVAPMNSTVLIHGETGTGKELIARTIHHNSGRADQRFVAFNAAAIPDGLAEAELFGHVKGAFTGAVANRPGRFELAHKGTLFIDEVASMPIALQTKLLRALQEREVERVGDAKPMKVDIRVIAATNTDLRALVKAGTFREDLYYRLNVIPVQLPPLRDRREDIPLLAQHFLKKACRDNGLSAKTLAQDTLRALMAHDWPGNVRQLENAVEYAAAMSGASPDVRVEALPTEVREQVTVPVMPSLAIPDEGLNFTSVVSQLERGLILGCLEKTGGNKRQAARLLSLSRTTFIDKLQRLNLAHDAA
jgi:two-component system response regulator AtoC